MERTSDNLPARRRKKKRKKRMPFSVRMGILTAVLVFIVAAAGALMAPGLRVTEVYCEGCENLKAEDVIAAAQLGTGENIFLAKVGRARRAVEDIPFVKEASVKRVFPDKLCISVTERKPVGYLLRGNECAVLGSDGIVLEMSGGDTFEAVSEYCTPAESPKLNEEQKDGKPSDNEGKSDENTDEDTDDEDTDNDTNTGGANQDGAEADKPEIKLPYSVPLIAGIELKSAESGKPVKAEDEGKLNTALGICAALDGAQLLNRATYLDVTNMSEVRLVLENRLDVQLGEPSNIEYRAKFLAEVINTKISAYEKAVLDYRGDDIYVRAPEDGKERVAPKREEDKSDTDTDDNDDTDNTEDSVSDDETGNTENDETNDNEDDSDGNADDDRNVGQL